MPVRRRRLIRAALAAALLAGPAAPLARAQGYGGLGRAAEGFALPRPDRALAFPRDHGPHPDFRIEWWYLTANLTAADGPEFGIQFTLFRSALAPGEAPGWRSPQIWMGHAGLTGETAHYAAERLARGGIGQAGVRSDPFAAWIDHWRMRGTPGAGLDQLDLAVQAATFGYQLTLDATGPLVLHGRAGYSVKTHDGQASHYYSQPRYRARGVLDLPQGRVAVTGRAWLDREWSSQPLDPDQDGWDWFALNFDSGAQLMGYRMRGARGIVTAGTWIGADGRAEPLARGAFRADPLETARVAGRDIPVRWRVRLPHKRLDAEIAALNPQSWMNTRFPYWEGPVRISGSHRGRGYLEMTGYQ